MSNYKILIADDTETNLIRIENILNNISNVEVVGKAKNGKEELEKILELNPDLVLTDNQMPILNGIDVIEKIRRDYKWESNIDFIIITADRNLTQRALSLNVFSIINKPYEDSKIIDSINEYIESVEYKKENIKDNNKNFFSKIFGKK